MSKNDEKMMTFGGHLEVLRKMLFRIIGVVLVLGIVIFCFKDITFDILLSPQSSEFITFSALEQIARWIGVDFEFTDYSIKLISTELSAQFMTHLSMTIYIAFLFASPYIVYELFAYISPALYEHERIYSIKIIFAIYLLFIIGVLLSYYILFPISFQFLATYQVDSSIENTITLSSYISTFTTLTFMLGLVFQLPVVCYFLAKIGIVSGRLLAKYKKHALIVVMTIAAIITPTADIFTLLLVTMPIYMLYLLGVKVSQKVNP